MTAEDLRVRLAALERRWEPFGGREAMLLRPGLDDAAMDALVAPLGYDLDEEQRAWWGWADGTAESSNYAYGRGQVVPAISLLPLNVAVQQYEFWIERAQDNPRLWPSHWLQLSDGQHPLVSAATATASTQVAKFFPEFGIEPRLESLMHLVDIWLWAWDSSSVRPTVSAPGWTGTAPDLPLEILGLGVLHAG